VSVYLSVCPPHALVYIFNPNPLEKLLKNPLDIYVLWALS